MATRKEYIDRGALLRDVDETVLFSVRGGTETPTPEMRGARKVIGRIEAAPAADVVEVVRCRECFYHDIMERCRSKQPDFFCAAGKRKDGRAHGRSQ